MSEFVVDRDTLAEVLHEGEHLLWPCRYEPEKCGHRRRAFENTDAILASGVVQDAADVRRAVAAEVWREGYQDGWSDRAHPGEDVTRNPYRRGATP